MKKIYTTVLLSIMFSLMVTFLTDAYVVGDVNRDNIVNAYDAIEVLKHSARIGYISIRIQDYADVNADGKIDSSDALCILEYSANLLGSFDKVINEPTPTPVATPEPTSVPTIPPVLSKDGTYNIYPITVINLNKAADYVDGEFTFKRPSSTRNGVEIVNPFFGENTDNGASISYWITTPVEVKPGNTDYTPVVSIFNNNTKEYIKFDFHGTRQYTVPNSSKINDWEANLTMEAGSTHFMTCVINARGLGYYIDGNLIEITNKSGSGSTAAQSMLPMKNVRFFIGGTDQIWSAMYPISKNAIPEGTVIKNFTAYNKGFSENEVKNLYETMLSNR